MDEFEQMPHEVARAILERHGWKRPMTAELKEMREVVDLPYTECKRYLVEEWQDMRVPLLEKENAKLRELVIAFDWCTENFDTPSKCDQCPLSQSDALNPECEIRMRELGVEV